MTIACLPTETSFDVQCPVCGKGFLLLSEPTLSPQSGSLRRCARKALSLQHTMHAAAGSVVHPQGVFDVEGWDGEPEMAWGLSVPTSLAEAR